MKKRNGTQWCPHCGTPNRAPDGSCNNPLCPSWLRRKNRRKLLWKN